jgi:hypothetical protein
MPRQKSINKNNKKKQNEIILKIKNKRKNKTLSIANTSLYLKK